MYGYRKIHAELVKHGVEVGDELVRRLMADLGLVSCHPRPWRITTIPGWRVRAGRSVETGLHRAEHQVMRFVGDITYISTWEGWLYLATVIDLCTKEVVGLGDGRPHENVELVCDSLTMAANHRAMIDGAVFHSDRGCQYTSSELARTSWPV